MPPLSSPWSSGGGGVQRWRLSRSPGSIPALPEFTTTYPGPPPTLSISLQKRLWEHDGFPLCVLICLLTFLLKPSAFKGQEVGGWLGQVSKEQPGPSLLAALQPEGWGDQL